MVFHLLFFTSRMCSRFDNIYFGCKSHALHLERVEDRLEENPFFPKSVPQQEEEMARELFGDSDSDWDELDGGKPLP